MFEGLRETIKGLNNDVKDVANCQRAKKLKRRLLIIGLLLAIIGYVGLFTCIAMFIINCTKNNTHSLTLAMIIPLVILLPFVVIANMGSKLASLGFKIIITGYTSSLVDETVGNNCPKCGTHIQGEKNFCPKCGYQLNKKCPQCGFVNNLNNEHCEKCGKKLQ